MNDLLKSSLVAEWGSASLVFVSAALVGRVAASGMNTSQLLGGACAIAGSIAVAVIVRVWPAQHRT